MWVIDVKKFRKFIGALWSINEEAKIRITKDGWKARVVDDAHVAMIDFTLPKHEFEEYNGEEQTIAIDVDEIDDFLNCVKEGTAEISVEDKLLTIKVGNIKRTFNLLDEELADVKQPELNYEARVEIYDEPLMEFVRVVKAASRFSDIICFKAKDGSFTISAKNETNSVECKVPAVVEGEAKAMYPLEDYILPIVQRLIMIKDTFETMGNIVLQFSNNMPCKIGVEDDIVYYMVAPRLIEEE